MFALLFVALAQECPYRPDDTPASSMYCYSQAFTTMSTMPRAPAEACDDLSDKRVMAHTKFVAENYGSFMDAAKAFPLAPLFDMKDLLVGDELYEGMLHNHIEVMKQPAAAAIEDKIILKTTAASAGVPTTEMYFGAHLGDFDRAAFRKALLGTCERGVEALFFKATHMAWSAGQKIVRKWQAECASTATLDAKIDELADYCVDEVLTLRNTDADSAHLAEAVVPGVIVEEIFQSGGLSTRPLEAKATFVWGKLYEVFMIGEDVRGCQSTSGSWKVYGNGEGWNLNGMLHEKDDASSAAFMADWFPQVKELGEKMATFIGADVTRVDFFLGEGGVVKLNEVETVSGTWYEHERRELGDIWRDGYIMSGRLSVTEAKWRTRIEDADEDRNKLIYAGGHGHEVPAAPIVV